MWSTYKPYTSRMRSVSTAIGAVSLIIFANLAQQGPVAHHETRDACIASLSGFPKDTLAPPKPQYPAEMTGVRLEYFASGCYGKCPAFTLTIAKGIATFDGHAYVRAKGKRTTKLNSQRKFLRHARRLLFCPLLRRNCDYCDGHSRIIHNADHTHFKKAGLSVLFLGKW